MTASNTSSFKQCRLAKARHEEHSEPKFIVFITKIIFKVGALCPGDNASSGINDEHEVEEKKIVNE